MVQIDFNELKQKGVKTAILKALETIPGYRNYLLSAIKDEILERLPPEVKKSISPEELQYLIDYSLLYVVFPRDQILKKQVENVNKKVKHDMDKFDKLTPKKLIDFMKMSPGYVPKFNKDFQQYVLRDIPRRVKESMPVPNYKMDDIHPIFKTIPADRQTDVKQILLEGIQKGWLSDKIRDEIIQKIGVPESVAETISTNEVRRAHHWAYSQILTQLGWTRKIFHSNPLACPKCKKLDRIEFSSDTAVIPDLTHPNCRCSVFPVAESAPHFNTLPNFKLTQPENE